MRRWGILAGVALGVALGYDLGRTSWTVDRFHVAADLSFAWGAANGLVVTPPAAVTLTLLPRPTLRMSGVDMRADRDALTVRAIRGEAPVRLDRLLFGQFAPVGLALSDAEVGLDVDLERAALQSLPGPAFDRVSLERAVVDLKSSQEGWESLLDVASARVDWRQSGLRAAVSGRWRKEPVQASLELDAPLAAIRGGLSPIRLSLDAPLAQWRFNGDWSPGAALPGGRLFLGQMSALAPSLARLATWLGAPFGVNLGGLELESGASGDRKSLALSDAHIKLDGQSFEGGLDLARTAAGVSASGALAADSLDLTPLIGPPPPLFDAAGAWSRDAALPAPDARLGLDLRVSASHVVWGDLRLDNAAAAVSQRDGALSLKLLEAGFAEGALGGELRMATKRGTGEAELAVTLENADLGAVLGALGAPNLSGRGGIKGSVRAIGRSPADLVASAEGNARVEIDGGELRGLNFEEALRRVRRRPLDVSRDLNAGATRFSLARGRIEISEGEAHFFNASTRTPGLTLALTGAVDLASRAWRARVEARQSTGEGEPSPEGARIDFALEGPWASPNLSPIAPPAD